MDKHNGAPAITFDEATHTYTVAGRPTPSVTQVIQPLFDFDKVPPEILRNKQILGQLVHDACELLVYDDLQEESLDPALAGYVDGFRLFLAETGFQAEETEEVVVSTRHGFVVPGRLDLVGKMFGWRWVLDIKTATAVNTGAAKLQTAAYQAAYQEQRPDVRIQKRGAIQLFPTGKYKLHKFASDLDLAAFLSLHQLNTWRSFNEC